jgi:predicted Holliday junction resolvase-like endonuclease
MKENETDVIQEILSLEGLVIKCPSCDEEFSAKQANLFDIRKPYPSKAKRLLEKQDNSINKELRSLLRKEGKIKEQIEKQKTKLKNLKEKKSKRPQRVQIITEKVNIGQIVEKILPSSKQFVYDPSDCRVLLTPIDYIAFNGFTKRGKVEKVSFIEVKTGNRRLQSNQSQIKEFIEANANKINVVEY